MRSPFLYQVKKKKKAEESKNVSSKDDQVRTVLYIFTRINDNAQ